jgi:hypothetical protein
LRKPTENVFDSCWTLGAPGPPHSCASAAGEAAIARAVMLRKASARPCLLFLWCLPLSTFIPLPPCAPGAVVTCRIDRSLGFATVLLITLWGDGSAIHSFE